MVGRRRHIVAWVILTGLGLAGMVDPVTQSISWSGWFDGFWVLYAIVGPVGVAATIWGRSLTPRMTVPAGAVGVLGVAGVYTEFTRTAFPGVVVAGTMAAVLFVLGSVDDAHRVRAGIVGACAVGVVTLLVTPLQSTAVFVMLVVGGGIGVLTGVPLLWLTHRTGTPVTET